MIFVTLIAFLLAVSAGTIQTQAIVGPIVRLRDVADRVSRGDMGDVEINVNSQDEIGDLAGAFRRMVASVRFLMANDTDEQVVETPFMVSPAGD
jgi:nitrogen fixation/metabolism regulation signal transduction histidine kinase